MAKYILEVLEEAQKKRTKAEKIEVLKKNESWALKDVLRGTFDSIVQWELPEGTPPYTASEPHNHPTNLLRENTKFAYFVKGGKSGQMPKFKRERLFIGVLEGIHPEDAKVVIDMINKKPPKYITRPIVEEAFPGLLKD